MLTHSPPLPLIIDYFDCDHDFTAEDKEGILLSLQHRDRVRSIRFQMPPLSLQKLIMALDDEFPILACLVIEPSRQQKQHPTLVLPRTFQAPCLHHLALGCFAFPIGFPLLTTTVGLITLLLGDILPSAHFPNDLLQILPLMTHLEILMISFYYPVPNRDVEQHQLRQPIMTHVTLPNLHWFTFKGSSAYLEALLPFLTTPALEKLEVWFFNQLTFSIPHLLRFIDTTENLRFNNAKLTFDRNGVSVSGYPSVLAKEHALFMKVGCRHLDWQVASAAQLLNALRMVLSELNDLTLKYSRSSMSPEWNNEADRSQWRELLRPFSKVDKLHVPDSLIGALSRFLQPEEGESPMDLLPGLKTLSYSGSGNTHNPFTAFIDSRLKAGHPVALVDF